MLPNSSSTPSRDEQTLRIATRKSPLALAQAGTVADLLTSSTGRRSVIVPISAAGDLVTESLASIGGTGVFAGAVREAVVDGRADVAVHSLKDLPTVQYPGLSLAAVPRRADPRDVLCASGSGNVGIADLPVGARVGTGSPRRVAQLRSHRPDLNVVDIRGNVGTRLGQVASGVLDAVILAYAGLARLAQLDAASSVIDPSVIVPAPGQGALALEVRSDLSETDPAAHAAIAALDHEESRQSVTGERSLLNALSAGCTSPVGALATVATGSDGIDSSPEPTINLQAVVASVDGAQVFRMSASGSANDAEQVGRLLARDLLAAGAAGLLGESSP